MPEEKEEKEPAEIGSDEEEVDDVDLGLGESSDYEAKAGDHDLISLQTSKSKSDVVNNSGQKGKTKTKRRKKRWLGVNLATCKYDCVKRVTKKFGFKEVEEYEDWTLCWTDFSVSLERVMYMKKYQKINHFPGMSEICRKDLLARNMNRLWKLFPKDYLIFPRTWCLPADYGDFQAFCRQKKNKSFILKPDSGSQGKGIYLTKNPKQDVKPGEDMICQQYISKPFLIDGIKFDLRIYALVTSCDPLRIFVYKDGLGRFATAKYAEPSNSNVENVYMHLTNYSINKNSEDFIRDEENGSKRRISVVNKWFEDHGYNVDEIWANIDDVIIKTLISAHPILKHNYRTCFPNHNKGSACFEILGFDVLLDKKLKPWILEVNHSPSFTTDSALDKEIKDSLVFDTLRLVNFSACDRKKYIEEEKRRVRERLLQKPKGADGSTKKEDDTENTIDLDLLKKYEDSHLGNFRRIYPEGDFEETYAKYFENSCSLFQETAASKARSECARIQREEIKAKTNEIEMMRKRNCGKRFIADGMRPESPKQQRWKAGTKRRPKFASKLRETRGVDTAHDVIDTTKPLEIDEEEELERVGNMLERDNLIRGLGVVEMVYRLLHGCAGTAGQQTMADTKTSTQDYTKHTSNERPHSSSQSITIRSYLSRFGASQHAANNTDNQDQNHNSRATSWNNRDGKKYMYSLMNNYASLHRPKLNTRKPGLPIRSTQDNIVEEEIRTISYGLDLDCTRTRLNKQQGYSNSALERTLSRSVHRLESLEPKHSFTSAQTLNVTPCQTFTNLQRYTKFDNVVSGLSIVSSAAPLQYKDDFGIEPRCISGGSHMELQTNCRSTRAQRIRGASNSVRLKQLELLETRALAQS